MWCIALELGRKGQVTQSLAGCRTLGKMLPGDGFTSCMRVTTEEGGLAQAMPHRLACGGEVRQPTTSVMMCEQRGAGTESPLLRTGDSCWQLTTAVLVGGEALAGMALGRMTEQL